MGLSDWATGIGSIGGAFISGEYNKKMASRQMAFQAKMSSTAHQREVADLRAAGLNPVMSVTGGRGASSPAGASASMPPVENPFAASAKTSLLTQQKKESESRVNLNTQQARLSSAKATQEETVTRRKLSEFSAVDEPDFARKIIPVLESLPPYLRGPARAATIGIGNTGKNVKETVGLLWRAFKANQEANEAQRKSKSRKKKRYKSGDKRHRAYLKKHGYIYKDFVERK